MQDRADVFSYPWPSVWPGDAYLCARGSVLYWLSLIKPPRVLGARKNVSLGGEGKTHPFESGIRWDQLVNSPSLYSWIYCALKSSRNPPNNPCHVEGLVTPILQLESQSPSREVDCPRLAAKSFPHLHATQPAGLGAAACPEALFSGLLLSSARQGPRDLNHT